MTWKPQIGLTANGKAGRPFLDHFRWLFRARPKVKTILTNIIQHFVTFRQADFSQIILFWPQMEQYDWEMIEIMKMKNSSTDLYWRLVILYDSYHMSHMVSYYIQIVRIIILKIKNSLTDFHLILLISYDYMISYYIIYHITCICYGSYW